MDRDEDDIDDRYYGKGLRKASGIVQNWVNLGRELLRAVQDAYNCSGNYG